MLYHLSHIKYQDNANAHVKMKKRFCKGSISQSSLSLKQNQERYDDKVIQNFFFSLPKSSPLFATSLTLTHNLKVGDNLTHKNKQLSNITFTG